ncbi:MAG: YedE family putative selenium transporter [Candidatus Methylomirabilia bacterium]
MRRLLSWTKDNLDLVAGAAVGLAGAGLVLLGNPRNSGICASCFAENVAGALRLHADPRMSYLRPELPGFLVGATLAALAGRGFQSRSGSAPLVRFFFGAFLIVGSAIFLGCPIKVVLRLAGGDLTAFAGLGGLVAGVWVGVRFLRKGFFLGKSARTGALAGWVLPGAMALLAAASVLAPAAFTGGLVGAAREHAPPLASLAIGLVVGALAQRSKFCVTGSLRNFMFTRRARQLGGLVLLFVAALGVNLVAGLFQPGLYDQPGSHMDWGWAAAGMFLVGLGAVLIGGCPFRQLVLAGEGDADAGAAVLGMLVAGGLVQSWGLRSTIAGVTPAGKLATLIGLVLVLGTALAYRDRS